MITATSPTRPAQSLSERERQALLRPISPPGLGATITVSILLAVFAWSAAGTELSLQKLLRGIPLVVEFFSRLWPPERSYWPQMLEPIAATLQMAILGTALSVVIATPFGLLAARNTTPSGPVYQGTRLLLNVVRAIPSLVWAIIFVAALGFGPFAGVIALGAAGLGTLGKLYVEAIEAINPRPVEAIRATGGAAPPVFSFAVLPQALPLMVSYTLLDFEANVRSATILGIVGAGGIGFELQASFSQFQFHQVLTILIEVTIIVTLIDRLSAFVRARLI
jgi:phosphonate transport system permease protein